MLTNWRLKVWASKLLGSSFETPRGFRDGNHFWFYFCSVKSYLGKSRRSDMAKAAEILGDVFRQVRAGFRDFIVWSSHTATMDFQV